jgi:two-component system response regulator ResD
MLTARVSEDDRITGLELGADDYLVKPFSPRELVSRVRAILRRVGMPEQAPNGQTMASYTTDAQGQNVAQAAKAEREKERLRFPGLTIDLAARRVEVHGKEIALTATEFDLLALLAQSPDRVFTREMLMNKVWGYDYLGDGHTIDVHMSALRKKIEQELGERYIKTVWRVGYRFEAKPSMKS